MKLFFINEGISESHKSLIERGNPLIYSINIYIYIYVGLQIVAQTQVEKDMGPISLVQ